MWQSVLLLMDSGLDAAVVWFLLILAALPGCAAAILAAYFIYTVVRLLLVPLIGPSFRAFAGSDLAKPHKKSTGSDQKRLTSGKRK